MKFGIGMYLWTTDVAPEHYPIFSTLDDLGYDGAEIPVGSGLSADYGEIRRVLDDAGLECTTNLNLAAEANPLSPDPDVRQRGLDEIRFGVDAAHVLGSTVLSGPFQTAYAVFSGAGPTEQELVWSAEVLRAAAEHAAGAGSGSPGTYIRTTCSDTGSRSSQGACSARSRCGWSGARGRPASTTAPSSLRSAPQPRRPSRR